jgi:hypothetical protein
MLSNPQVVAAQPCRNAPDHSVIIRKPQRQSVRRVSRRCRATITPRRTGLALAGMRPAEPTPWIFDNLLIPLFIRRMALFVHLLEMHNPAQPSTISTRKYEPALGPISTRSKHLGFDRPGRTGLRSFPDATPAPGPSERNSPLSPVLLQLVMQRLQTDA